MSNLILVRHGQSLWNKERRFTGWADVNLTKKGESEALLAGKLIKKLDIKFNKYFTSKLKRATNSLDIILKVLDDKNPKILKTTKLNERHYGDLTSLNKDETIKKFGYEQVNIWRRSFNTPPPEIGSNNPYKNKINTSIQSESLKDTFERVIPFYEKEIEPLLTLNKNILIVFHGNSCRSLLKKIFKISNKNIIKLEIPTGNPLLIKLEKNFNVKEYKYLDANRAKRII
jgi:2,3-bisphosphoglycerate-dependent phosphoglycerate mutase